MGMLDGKTAVATRGSRQILALARRPAEKGALDCFSGRFGITRATRDAGTQVRALYPASLPPALSKGQQR